MKPAVVRAFRPAIIAAWLLGAVVVWNTVFDDHIVRGARRYVDEQQRFIDGRGPRVDMEQAMSAARAEGGRRAWLWTGAELVPGAVLWLWLRRRARATR
jgi:hypothetical protein